MMRRIIQKIAAGILPTRALHPDGFLFPALFPPQTNIFFESLGRFAKRRMGQKLSEAAQERRRAGAVP
jgi:hypothetical protein